MKTIGVYPCMETSALLDVGRQLDVATALLELRQVGKEFPAMDFPYPVEEPTFLPPESEENTQAVEAAFGRNLPTEYCEYVSLCGGVEVIDVFNGPDLFGPSGALGFDDSMPRQVRQTAAILVGADGGGNLFLMDAGTCSVWKWLHATCDTTGEPETGGLVKVSTDFGEFLVRVLEDWRRFLANDQEWVYLA